VRKPNRRRRFIVEAHQYRRMALQILYIFIFMFLLSAVLFIPLVRQLDSDSLPFYEKQLVAYQILAIHNWLLPSFIIILALFVVNFIIDAHRISGPLFRFRMIFKSVAEGNLCVNTTIRKNDYLQKEANVLSTMVNTLRSRIDEIKISSGDVGKACRDLKSAIDPVSTDEIENRFCELEENIKSVQRLIDRFDTGTEKIAADGVPPAEINRDPWRVEAEEAGAREHV
jgi:methyl-accepting chemotaxis protein